MLPKIYYSRHHFAIVINLLGRKSSFYRGYGLCYLTHASQDGFSWFDLYWKKTRRRT